MTPVPLPGETVASYAARLDAATAAHPGHLWRLAVSTYRQNRNLPARSRVSQEIAEREALALCRKAAGSLADRLVLLGNTTRIVWHACLKCSNGASVALHPDRGQLVCPVHETWTGPTLLKGRNAPPPWVVPPPAQQHSLPVDKDIVEAAGRIQSSITLTPIITEVLRRAASAVRNDGDGEPKPADLPTAAAILETITDSAVIHAVCDFSRPYSDAYKAVAHRMHEAGNPASDAGIDQAWLILRWTAAAARCRFGGEWNTEDPRPLLDPVEAQASAGPPLQPFHTFMDCLRTRHRDDHQWWEDRYRQRGVTTRYLCPEGHVSRRHPPKNSFHGPYDSACSICSGRKVFPGYNSLADRVPWLLDEWDLEADHEATPWTVSTGSNKVGHWICPQGHHYDAMFAQRALRGTGCPHCGFGKVLPGTNDLATTHPQLASLWDPGSSNKKEPREITAGNAKDRIHWRCPRGHSFVRTPLRLVASGGRCNVCDGRVLLAGFNDLATKRPDVAAQWNHARNGTLTPDQVVVGSDMKVWWVCPSGHEFERRISNRCRYPKLTCPVETGKILQPGVSDLATREPLLVRDWDHDRNGFASAEVVPGTRRYWWTCPAGHTQHVSVVNRRRAGGCTRCPPHNRAVPNNVRQHRSAWSSS
ncbi:zinc-ribbon domain-containing protein [Arthrobacter sp. SLBN-122]|uniref:zinc-ribbon domain-containing protein n=1 Tax=Arthrobacter sp. SLBN-122 TaxID=2768455 RepID=UPI001171693E|nr:putative zinc ribbon protein [Arthrobacter sp. SLBN-122]